MRRRLSLLLAIVVSGCAAPIAPTQTPTPADLVRLTQRAERDRSVDAQVALGSALRAAGQRDSARALLGRLVAAHPGSAPAVLNLALTDEDLADYGAAADLYRRYLTLGGSAPLRGQIRGRLALVERKQLLAGMRGALAQEYQLATMPPTPRTVAVFPFLYAGSDPQFQPLGRALSALLTTDLSQTQRLRVLERTQVQALLDEMKLSETGLVDSATAVRSGHLLRASRVVDGQIAGSSDALRIAAAVIGVGGNVAGVSPVEVQDPVARLFDMEKQVALGLYSSMGIELTPAERERVEHRATQNLQALLEFGWGLEAEDAGRFAEAARHFHRAKALDPGFTQAGEAAQQADEQSAAAALSTDQLAAAASGELRVARFPTPSLVDRDIRTGAISVVGLYRIVGLDPVTVLLPDPIARNPGSELLGFDGLAAPARAIVIVRR